jgi:hypothetical protein
MTEEVKDAGVEIAKGEAAAANVETSQTAKKEAKEDQARAMGWKSEAEWVEDGKDPEDHVSAKEFVNRQSFFKKIEAQNREMANLRGALDEQSRFNKMVFDEAKKKAIEELKAQHRQAVEDGQADKATEIADKIADEKAKPAPQGNTVQGPSPIAKQWVEDNPWYQQDDVKRAYANEQGAVYINYQRAATGRIPSEEDILNHVANKVKEKFPAQPRRTVTAPAGGVEGAGNRTGKTKTNGISRDDLSPMEQTMMDTLVKKGKITEQKYLEQMTALNKRKQ